MELSSAEKKCLKKHVKFEERMKRRPASRVLLAVTVWGILALAAWYLADGVYSGVEAYRLGREHGFFLAPDYAELSDEGSHIAFLALAWKCWGGFILAAAHALMAVLFTSSFFYLRNWLKNHVLIIKLNQRIEELERAPTP